MNTRLMSCVFTLVVSLLPACVSTQHHGDPRQRQVVNAEPPTFGDETWSMLLPRGWSTGRLDDVAVLARSPDSEVIIAAQSQDLSDDDPTDVDFGEAAIQTLALVDGLSVINAGPLMVDGHPGFTALLTTDDGITMIQNVVAVDRVGHVFTCGGRSPDKVIVVCGPILGTVCLKTAHRLTNDR